MWHQKYGNADDERNTLGFSLTPQKSDIHLVFLTKSDGSPLGFLHYGCYLAEIRISKVNGIRETTILALKFTSCLKLIVPCR